VDNRIRCERQRQRICAPKDAAARIRDGIITRMSSFTRAGDPRAVPVAMAPRAKFDPSKITLLTAAS